MTLKWGSTTCTAIYWGSTKCTTVYWGSTIVWPEGYLGYLTSAWITRSSSSSWYQTNATSYGTSGTVPYATIDTANRKITAGGSSSYNMYASLITSQKVSISGSISVTVTTNASANNAQPRFIYGTSAPSTISGGSNSDTLDGTNGTTGYGGSYAIRALTSDTAKSFSLSGSYYVGVMLRLLTSKTDGYYVTITALG